MELHRGEPLTGVDGAWAVRTREQLTGELLTARAEWAEAEVAVGNATAVLAPLATLADANPLVEPLVVALVRALVAAGRPTEALERCRLHRQRLAEEYGTDPSPQLMRLYESGPARRRSQSPTSAGPGAARRAPRRRPNGGPGRRPRSSDRHAGAVLASAVGAVVSCTPGRHLRRRRLLFWPEQAGPPRARFTATEDFSGTGWHPCSGTPTRRSMRTVRRGRRAWSGSAAVNCRSAVRAAARPAAATWPARCAGAWNAASNVPTERGRSGPSSTSAPATPRSSACIPTSTRTPRAGVS